ncbi:hypothetical protein Tdes44962_MAKER05746 [Teratosphaeria destructans]|uniref:Uncharacterized protein n=1 Tax=Teratosphaeria destructans TaxID=418781 RepID=A0A9W7SJ25_9PEZI|nr:hypothetical protein Tdes44962_MAKER05746 [Teratosphaeria destructans]
MQSRDENGRTSSRTGAHAARVSSVSPAEIEAQKLDDQAMELAMAPNDQSGPRDAHVHQELASIAATPYLGTFEVPDPTSSQEPQDPADQPSSRIFFPTQPNEKDFRPGKNSCEDEAGSTVDFRGAGPAHRAYTRQLLQAQHFRSISDTTSIVAVLIAALPWTILSQPVVPPTNFTSATTFTFVALSSSLSVVLALLCQFAKLLYTLRPPGRTGFRTTMLAYVLEDVAQLALLQIGLVAILFFFLAMAAYSLVVGYVFVAVTAVAILALTAWWLFVFVSAMQKAYEHFVTKADEMGIPRGQRRGLAAWRRVLLAMAQPSENTDKIESKQN